MITEIHTFFENKGSNNKYLEVSKINSLVTSTGSCAAFIVRMRVRKPTHEDLTGEGKYYEYRIFHGKYGDAMEPVKALQKWIAKVVNRVKENSLASTKLNRYCDEE